MDTSTPAVSGPERAVKTPVNTSTPAVSGTERAVKTPVNTSTPAVSGPERAVKTPVNYFIEQFVSQTSARRHGLMDEEYELKNVHSFFTYVTKRFIVALTCIVRESNTDFDLAKWETDQLKGTKCTAVDKQDAGCAVIYLEHLFGQMPTDTKSNVCALSNTASHAKSEAIRDNALYLKIELPNTGQNLDQLYTSQSSTPAPVLKIEPATSKQTPGQIQLKDLLARTGTPGGGPCPSDANTPVEASSTVRRRKSGAPAVRSQHEVAPRSSSTAHTAVTRKHVVVKYAPTYVQQIHTRQSKTLSPQFVASSRSLRTQLSPQGESATPPTSSQISSSKRNKLASSTCTRASQNRSSDGAKMPPAGAQSKSIGAEKVSKSTLRLPEAWRHRQQKDPVIRVQNIISNAAVLNKVMSKDHPYISARRKRKSISTNKTSQRRSISKFSKTLVIKHASANRNGKGRSGSSLCDDDKNIDNDVTAREIDSNVVNSNSEENDDIANDTCDENYTKDDDDAISSDDSNNDDNENVKSVDDESSVVDDSDYYNDLDMKTKDELKELICVFCQENEFEDLRKFAEHYKSDHARDKSHVALDFWFSPNYFVETETAVRPKHVQFCNPNGQYIKCGLCSFHVRQDNEETDEKLPRNEMVKQYVNHYKERHSIDYKCYHCGALFFLQETFDFHTEYCAKNLQGDKSPTPIQSELRSYMKLQCSAHKVQFTDELMYADHMCVFHAHEFYGAEVIRVLNLDIKTLICKYLARVAYEFICSLCTKESGKVVKFENGTDFVTHARFCHPAKVFCDICLQFSSFTLKRHRAHAHALYSTSYFKCIVGNCLYKAPEVDRLVEHVHFSHRDLDSESGVKFKRSCTKCDYSVPLTYKSEKVIDYAKSSSAFLKHHNLKHDFKVCDKCGQMCTKTSYNRHYQTHVAKETAIAKFTCYVCGKCFVSYRELKLHEKRHDESNRSEECTLCNKKFFNKAEVHGHAKTTHRMHWCRKCDKYWSAGELTEHHRVCGASLPALEREKRQSAVKRKIVMVYRTDAAKEQALKVLKHKSTSNCNQTPECSSAVDCDSSTPKRTRAVSAQSPHQ